METLEELKDHLDKDPCEILRLLAKDNVSDHGDVLPQRQTVAKVPDIDWTKYRLETDGVRASASAGYNTRKKGGKKKVEEIEEVVMSVGSTESERKRERSRSYGKPWTEEEQVWEVGEWLIHIINYYQLLLTIINYYF